MITCEAVEPTLPDVGFDEILNLVELNSHKWERCTTKDVSRELGQVFSPLAMAKQLVSLPRVNDLTDFSNHICDVGAGTGVLGISLNSRIHNHSGKIIQNTLFENDDRIIPDLESAWQSVTNTSSSTISYLLLGDFTEHVNEILTQGNIPGLKTPNVIVTNPPYLKLSRKSKLSQELSKHGIVVPNQYAAFIILSTKILASDGHLLAVLPRSFCSGDYFSEFRTWIKRNLSVQHVVIYKQRNCFKNVLQETILVYFKKNTLQTKRVRLTVSNSPFEQPEYEMVIPATNLLQDESWLLPRSPADINLINQHNRKSITLSKLGIEVSTGKIELHRNCEVGETPIIYSKDFDQHGNWTWAEKRKPRMLKAGSRQILSLPETGGYILIKRISANQKMVYVYMPQF